MRFAPTESQFILFFLTKSIYWTYGVHILHTRDLKRNKTGPKAVDPEKCILCDRCQEYSQMNGYFFWALNFKYFILTAPLKISFLIKKKKKEQRAQGLIGVTEPGTHGWQKERWWGWGNGDLGWGWGNRQERFCIRNLRHYSTGRRKQLEGLCTDLLYKSGLSVSGWLSTQETGNNREFCKG